MPKSYLCWGQIVMLIGFISLPLKVKSESNPTTPTSSNSDIGEEYGAKVLPIKAEHKIYVDGTEIVDLNCSVAPSYLERMLVLEDFYFSRKTKEDKDFCKITEINKQGHVVWFPSTESKWKKLTLMKKYRGIEGKVESKDGKNISATITLHIPVYPCREEGTFRCFIDGIFKRHSDKNETKRQHTVSYFRFNGTLCDFKETSGEFGPRTVLIVTLISTIVVLFACICAAIYKLVQLIKKPAPTKSSKRKHGERRKRRPRGQNNPTPRTVSNNAIPGPCFTPPPSPMTKRSTISHPTTTKMMTTSTPSLTTPLITPKFRTSCSNMLSSVHGLEERSTSQFVSHSGVHQALNVDTILEQTPPTVQAIPPPPPCTQPTSTIPIVPRESTTRPPPPRAVAGGNLLHAALMKRRTRLSSSMHVSSRHGGKW